MTTSQARLTFTDQKDAQRFADLNSDNPKFTLKMAPTSNDIVPADPLPYSDTLFDALASEIDSHVDLEYGDSLPWPVLPLKSWNALDRRELVQTASTRWELQPDGTIRQFLFFEDLSARLLDHLGTTA